MWIKALYEKDSQYYILTVLSGIMLFYTIIFGIVASLTFLQEMMPAKKRRVTDVIILLILASLSAMHGIGGTDYEIYQAAYNRIPNVFEFLSNHSYYRNEIFHFEVGYLFIISIFKTIGCDYYMYMVLQSVLFYALMYKGLHKFSNHWGLIMLVFMYKMFVYDTFVAMRQGLTISGFFFILQYLYNREAKKYFIGCLILSLIHNGAVILFPLYCINYFNLTRQRLFILLLLFLPTVILAHSGLGARLNTLMTIINATKGESYSNATETVNIAYTLEYYLIMSLVCINYRRIATLKYGTFIIKLSLILLPMVTLFSGILILRREMDYFFPVYGIIGGYLCEVLPKNKLIIVAAYTFICYYGFNRYLHNFDQGGMIPYKTWIETSK